ncbi:DNAJ like chaperone [Cryptosporidium bovis]|uniref:DNAJ like chaperone n=1 Tax=Cryptosporidium bovis TaxID=310047 RepID=UPI00351A4A5B|nr:DNAJ like chaperone [Cryptosporidium bovis]
MMEEILVQCFLGTVILYIFFSRGKGNHPNFPKLYKFRFFAGGILCLFPIVYCIITKKPTYYDLIGIDRWAPRGELIQAIRIAKKKYHPDKSKEDDKTTSTLLFYEIQKIETVFNSDTKRNNYNKYGDFRMDGVIEDRNIIMCLILGVAFQVYSSLLGFFFSFPTCFRKSRTLFPVYSIAVFCAELHMRISDDPNPLSFIPFVGNLLPFEKIIVLRSLFPVILYMSFIYSSNNYKNYDEILNDMLKGNLITNKRIIDLTQSLIIQLQTRGIGGNDGNGNNNNKHKKKGSSSTRTPDQTPVQQQTPKIKIDSDNEDESQLEVLQQITEPLKELASTMNDAQKQQLQSVLNIAFSAKLKEKNEKSGGILSRIFNSSFLWIIIVGYGFQVLKKYLI